MKTLLFLFLILPLTTLAQGKEPGSLAVHGEGEIKVRPDVANIQFTIYARDKEAKVAQQKTSEEYARVIKLLKNDFKIEEKDLKTTGYYINPEYRFDKNRQVFMGEQVNHSFQVRVREMDRIGDILDKALSHNYTEDFRLNVQGIWFDTEKRREYENQALTSAMDNARARAETLAKLARRNLRSVQRISDANVNFQTMPLARGRQESRMAGAASMLMESSSGAGTMIPSGEITINTTVNVEFEME